jgi:hypothetical protein
MNELPVNTSICIDKYNKHKCCARLASKPGSQCSFNIKHTNGGYGLCNRHYKMGISNIKTIYQDVRKIVNKCPASKFINLDVEYSNNLSSIIKIQSVVRKYIVNNNIYYRGITCYCRHLCNNKSDCTTLSNINEIEIKNYFSYCDNNQHWGFNVATFKELLKYSDANPYNTCKIGQNILNKFNKLLTILDNKNIKIESDIITNPYIKLQQRCVGIFQRMDNLKQYTQCKWFLNLNIVQLKELYKQLEDIWNYRINLSNDEKKKYVKNGKLFVDKIHIINKINSYNKIASILLDNFNKLITEGINNEYCTTGALWILSGLTIVSKDARDALPWLFQSAHPIS